MSYGSDEGKIKFIFQSYLTDGLRTASNKEWTDADAPPTNRKGKRTKKFAQTIYIFIPGIFLFFKRGSRDDVISLVGFYTFIDINIIIIIMYFTDTKNKSGNYILVRICFSVDIIAEKYSKNVTEKINKTKYYNHFLYKIAQCRKAKNYQRLQKIAVN